LTDEQRAAVANYFSIYKGTENGKAKLMVPPTGICHPSLERALVFIKDAWEEVPPPLVSCPTPHAADVVLPGRGVHVAGRRQGFRV
jgi:hypothetical protein